MGPIPESFTSANKTEIISDMWEAQWSSNFQTGKMRMEVTKVVDVRTHLKEDWLNFFNDLCLGVMNSPPPPMTGYFKKETKPTGLIPLISVIQAQCTEFVLQNKLFVQFNVSNIY